MKKAILITCSILVIFFMGFFTRQYIPLRQLKPTAMKKVTGIGGVFFKCKDPEKVREWYSKHLGLKMDQYGTSFEWLQSDDPTKHGLTQWSAFSDSTNYFDPSVKEFMINYRVHDLESLVIELKRDGVEIVDSIESYDYGKFIHILDNEGNKIELWEPVDTESDENASAGTK
jgi:predicted enzyme related to lactoylglutathione lyase